ncbi:DUF3892 domain-containing protein [Paenibacillus sp. NFR01]|uniref:DUF3892 domain-containing protein n=1 Tax=Paenibacillus sp. NFR01 TaxID=1566279 RepID=UPI000B83D0BD|nr:DUF3892 domain-containing protein [Paenibacillus sp. NFR01]
MAKMEQERERFIAAQRNNDGDLIRFRTSAGRELDYGQALQEVQAGRIAGVNAFKAKDGQLHIRGDADGDPTNNLSELPQF